MVKPVDKHYYRLVNGTIVKLCFCPATSGCAAYFTADTSLAISYSLDGKIISSSAPGWGLAEEVIVTEAPKPATVFVGYNLYRDSSSPLKFHTGVSHMQATREEVIHSLKAAGGVNPNWVASNITEIIEGTFPLGLKNG